MRGRFMRGLFVAHRYLGIAVGIVMVIWCLSGFVMMYVPYPQLAESERVAHLTPIQWSNCCVLPRADELVEAVQVEMLGGRPVARVVEQARGPAADAGILTSGQRTRLIDITSGEAIAGVSAADAESVVRGFASAGSITTPRLVRQIDHDQWTVQGAHGPNRPLLQFDLQDGAGTELYVSTLSGKAIQRTTARERFWNWLGSVPHWIYFTALRQDGHLWTQVVVWISLTGSFLTLTGIYIGICQWQPRRSPRRIPYRGLHYYHHLLGLLFGLFVLTWVVSGLVSVNPWGFLEGEGFDEPQRLQGAAHDAREIESLLTAFARSPYRSGTVSMQSVPLGGHLYLIDTRTDGTRFRVNAQAALAALSSADLEYIGKVLDRDGAGYQLDRLVAEDTYYFSHHRQRAELPAYRVILNDAVKTRYYLDPVSGEIRAKFDGDGQWYRWLHQALHRMDFSAVMRSHPLWDTVTLFLLSGATMICVLGLYVGVRSLTRR